MTNLNDKVISKTTYRNALEMFCKTKLLQPHNSFLHRFSNTIIIVLHKLITNCFVYLLYYALNPQLSIIVIFPHEKHFSLRSLSKYLIVN